jgi:ABC-type uncharacterized transport system substrate-binding protein
MRSSLASASYAPLLLLGLVAGKVQTRSGEGGILYLVSRRRLLRTGAALGVFGAGLLGLWRGTPAAAAPEWAQGQSDANVALLAASTREGTTGLAAFAPELSRLRRAEGRSVTIEERFGQGDQNAIERYARELLSQAPAVIVVSGAAPLAALMPIAGSTPIVFTGVGDPVTSGFVASFEHPGGTMTGVSGVSGTPAPVLYMRLMRELFPAVSRVAYPWWDNATPSQTNNAEQHDAIAQQLGVTLTSYPLKTVDDLQPALEGILSSGEQAIRISGDALLTQLEPAIEAFSRENRLPVIWGAPHARRWTVAGYGSDADETWRRLAMLVDLVLAGASPGELPVQQLQANTQLVVNKRAAEQLGVAIPDGLLARATELIA